MSRRGNKGLTSMTVLMELLEAFPEGVTLGILQDNVTATLKRYLKDGRTRSVKHAIENLRKYGIISEGISTHGEPAYSIKSWIDDFMGPFINLLTAVDDMTDKLDGRADDCFPPESLSSAHPAFSELFRKHEDWNQCTWKFNVVEAIEDMLWEERSMTLLLRLVKGLAEDQGVLVDEQRSNSPSLLDFMGKHIKAVKKSTLANERIKEFYRMIPIERVYSALLYVRGSLVHILSAGHPDIAAKKLYEISESALFMHFIDVCRVVLPGWIDYKLNNRIPGLSYYSQSASIITPVLLEHADWPEDKIPAAVKRKFGIEESRRANCS